MPLEMNTGQGGMKRIMDEVVAWRVEAIRYSTLVGIRVGGEKRTGSENNTEFGRWC